MTFSHPPRATDASHLYLSTTDAGHKLLVAKIPTGLNRLTFKQQSDASSTCYLPATTRAPDFIKSLIYLYFLDFSSFLNYLAPCSLTTIMKLSCKNETSDSKGYYEYIFNRK